MNASQGILVSGAPRSGTTWVGRTLALAPSTYYLHEPFNISTEKCSCGASFDTWFLQLTNQHPQHTLYYEHFAHLLGPAWHRFNVANLITDLKAAAGTRLALKHIQNFAIKAFSARTIIKDPIAVFSVEWLAANFDIDVVIMIRHPAGFVSSYKRLNWSHPFEDFLGPNMICESYIEPFRAEIETHVAHDHDIVDTAILLWRMIYHATTIYRERHPEWIFIRHEDIAANPVTEFRHLFNRLGLTFSERIQSKIQAMSAPTNPVEVDDPYAITRNSSQIIHAWKQRLDHNEIRKIQLKTEDIAAAFYAAEDW